MKNWTFQMNFHGMLSILKDISIHKWISKKNIIGCPWIFFDNVCFRLLCTHKSLFDTLKYNSKIIAFCFQLLIWWVFFMLILCFIIFYSFFFFSFLWYKLVAEFGRIAWKQRIHPHYLMREVLLILSVSLFLTRLVLGIRK